MRITPRYRWAVPGVLCLALVGLVPATAAQAEDFPFRDPDLPLQARIDDLLGRLTLDEKISLLHQYQLPVPRLGIGQFRSRHRGAARPGVDHVASRRRGAHRHRDRRSRRRSGSRAPGTPTCCTQVGSAVGDEARGYNTHGPGLWGLNLWAPVVNLLRDPRWGRNEEGYSEDPLLTGAISTAYGKGMRATTRST